MKAVVAAFNQKKDLVGAFSVITNLRMDLFEALNMILLVPGGLPAEVLFAGLEVGVQDEAVPAATRLPLRRHEAELLAASSPADRAG